MNHKMYDIHSHVNFGIDDGAADLDMSISMLREYFNQGVYVITCTSHHDGNMNKYYQNFYLLKEMAYKEGIDIKLCVGNEIYCCKGNIIQIVNELNSKTLFTINNTQYVLIEFSPYVWPNEIIKCVMYLQNNGYKVIIAHVERYKALFAEERWIKILRHIGCLFQVNAYDFQESRDNQIRTAAQKLLDEKFVDFLGSDAHRINHRPPNVYSGIEFVYQHCCEEYAKDVLYRNAIKFLNM